MGHSNHVLDGGLDPPGERAILGWGRGRPIVVFFAMRPFIELLRSLFYVYLTLLLLVSFLYDHRIVCMYVFVILMIYCAVRVIVAFTILLGIHLFSYKAASVLRPKKYQ